MTLALLVLLTVVPLSVPVALVLGVAPLSPPPPSRAALAAAPGGEAVFASRCAACHSDRAGETGLPGPNLHGLAGRRLGGDPAFDYSPAFRAASGTWDASRLDAYLADPEEAVPGSWMGWGNGVRDPAERAAAVRHLLGGGG